MSARPQRQTARLRLRSFLPDHAPLVQLLAGERRVAETTAAIPHPYPPGAAMQWIDTHAAAWAAKTELSCAIVRLADDALVGAVGLRLDVQQRAAELGYWIGLPYWGSGYATEAARAMLELAFTDLKLTRVQAHYLLRNPASGRVLHKIGLREEQRKSATVRDAVQEIAVCAISRAQWLQIPRG